MPEHNQLEENKDLTTSYMLGAKEERKRLLSILKSEVEGMKEKKDYSYQNVPEENAFDHAETDGYNRGIKDVINIFEKYEK